MTKSFPAEGVPALFEDPEHTTQHTYYHHSAISTTWRHWYTEKHYTILGVQQQHTLIQNSNTLVINTLLFKVREGSIHCAHTATGLKLMQLNVCNIP